MIWAPLTNNCGHTSHDTDALQAYQLLETKDVNSMQGLSIHARLMNLKFLDRNSAKKSVVYFARNCLELQAKSQKTKPG